MSDAPPANVARPSATIEFDDDSTSMSRREVAFVGAFWMLFGLVTFANRVLDPRRPGVDQDIWLAMMAISAAQAAMWALATVPLFLLAARAAQGREPLVVRALLLLLAAMVAAWTVSAIADAVRDGVFPSSRRFGAGRGGFGRGNGGATGSAGFGRVGFVLTRERPWWMFGFGGFQFLNDIIIAMGVLAGGFARAYSRSARAREAQASRLNAQLAEAKLDALRRQLDPHFLFNTLHAVSSLVERDPRGVRRMIARLSDLLRHSIDGSSDAEVSVRQEIELLTRYIDIMQVRFQGTLAVETHVGDDVADAMVPNLILQPLVENAIKHGVEQVGGAGRIEISVGREAGELVLTIRDNGPGPQPTQDTPDGRSSAGTGIGMRNTRARLEQLYGGSQSLTILPGKSGGTVVEVRLPFHVNLATVALPNA